MTDEQKAIFAWMKTLRFFLDDLIPRTTPEQEAIWQRMAYMLSDYETNYLTACQATKEEGIK